MKRYKRYLVLALLAGLVSFLTGCQDTVPGLVEYNLTNNTAASVTVYYARETESGFGDNTVQQQTTIIAAGETKSINTQPGRFYDGHFTAVSLFHSSMHTYSPGTSEGDRDVTIDTADF